MGGAQRGDNPFPKEESCDNAENTCRRPGIYSDTQPMYKGGTSAIFIHGLNTVLVGITLSTVQQK